MDTMGFQDGHTFFDIGCSTGRVLFYISKLYPCANIIGTDINDNAVQIAHALMNPRQRPDITTILSVAQDPLLSIHQHLQDKPTCIYSFYEGNTELPIAILLHMLNPSVYVALLAGSSPVLANLLGDHRASMSIAISGSQNRRTLKAFDITDATRARIRYFLHTLIHIIADADPELVSTPVPIPDSTPDSNTIPQPAPTRFAEEAFV
jgi:hypothetical protein